MPSSFFVIRPGITSPGGSKPIVSIAMNDEAQITQIKEAPGFVPVSSFIIHKQTNKDIYVILGATVHQDGIGYKPGAYAPLKAKQLSEIAHMVSSPGVSRIPVHSVFNSRVLFYKPDVQRPVLVVWHPADKWQSNWSMEGLKNKKMPWPPVIAVVRQNQMRIFALDLAEGEQPTEETQLLCPPFPNVSAVGSICMGSMNIPVPGNYGTVDELGYAWLNSFFVSKGNSDHSRGVKTLNIEGELIDLWKQLQKDKPDTFPTHVLLPTKDKQLRTVGDLIKNVTY